MELKTILAIVLGGIPVLAAIFLFFSNKKCPQGKIMIIFGKKSREHPYTITSGKSVIIPFIHKVKYLDLRSFQCFMQIMAKDMEGNNLKVHLEIKYAISTNPVHIYNAVEQLLDLSSERIQSLGDELIKERVKRETANKQINTDDFLRLQHELEEELIYETGKLGLEIKGIEITFEQQSKK